MAAEQNVAGQTAPEQPVAQPAAAPVTQVADEGPAQDRAEASAPTRDDGAAVEEGRALSPALNAFQWKLNPKKCIFDVPSSILLDNIVNYDGMKLT